MDPGPLSRAEHKHACLLKIFTAELNDIQRRPLVNCVESYLELTPEEAAEFEALGHLGKNREVHAMAMTWEERMMAKGREEGLQVGREEGEQQGTRQLVLELLGERFGAVPDRIRRKVDEIESVDRLRFLAKKVLKAQSSMSSGSRRAKPQRLIGGPGSR